MNVVTSAERSKQIHCTDPVVHGQHASRKNFM